MATDNLFKIPVEKLGAKAGLLQYVRDLLDDLESGRVVGVAIIRLAAAGGSRTAWGYVPEGGQKVERMLIGATVLKHRLTKIVNGEDDD